MAEFAITLSSLILREWRDSDFDPFLAMGRDPEVMAYLGPLREPDDVWQLINRLRSYQAEFGYCAWALEQRSDGAMIGFCGLVPGPAGTPIEGKVEIGWRLARAAWGKGYARDAAMASLDWAWANLDLPTIWAITVEANTRSWGLMQRLGMTRHHDLDFDHPNVADDSALKRHMTWSIDRPGTVSA